MRKNSSKKSISAFIYAISKLAFVVFFALQPSAQAFSEVLQITPISNSAPLAVQPSPELSSISSKTLIQNALLSIDAESSKIRSVVSTPSNLIVSVFSYQNHYRHFTRLVFATATPEEGYPYQAYEINPGGSLGRLIETGKMISSQFVRERIYDYKTGTVTLYDPKNVFEKRTYELKANGEPGRPFQYRGRTSAGDLVNVRFLYQGNTVTSLNLQGMSYATYVMNEGTLGALLEIGTAVGISRQGKLAVSSRIKLSSLSRKEGRVPVYIFEENNGSYLIRERQGALNDGLGAIGRVLRFVSSETDLEYFYDDAVNGGMAKVKVINHRAGESLTFEVAKKELKDPSGQIHRESSRHADQLLKAVSNSIPSIHKEFQKSVFISSSTEHRPIYVRLNDEVLVWEKLLRGPPAFKGETFDFAFPFSAFRLVLFPSFIFGFIPFFSSGVPA